MALICGDYLCRNFVATLCNQVLCTVCSRYNSLCSIVFSPFLNSHAVLGPCMHSSWIKYNVRNTYFGPSQGKVWTKKQSCKEHTWLESNVCIFVPLSSPCCSMEPPVLPPLTWPSCTLMRGVNMYMYVPSIVCIIALTPWVPATVQLNGRMCRWWMRSWTYRRYIKTMKFLLTNSIDFIRNYIIPLISMLIWGRRQGEGVGLSSYWQVIREVKTFF